jgi:multidrug resistance protein
MLLTLCSVVAMVMVGMGIVTPILPLYAQSFGVSALMVGMVITSFGLARALVDLPAGHWAERLGRRPLLVAGPAVFMVGSFLCGIAPNLWFLVLFRLLQGAGSAMYATAAMTSLTDISTPENRGRVMSTYQGTLLLGSALGPTLGGVIAHYWGLQAPFFFTAFLGLLSTLWALWRIPETGHWEQPREGSGVPAHQAGPTPGGIRTMLLNGNFLLIGLVSFAIFFTMSGARQTIVPLLGHNQLSLNEIQIGFTITVITMLNFVAILPSGILSDRFGRKAAIVPATAVAGAGLILFTLGNSYAFFLLSAALLGAGRGIAGPAPMAYVGDIAPRGSHGISSGLYRTFSDIGLMLGPIVLGWIVDLSGFAWALYFNAGLLLLCAILFGVLAQETAGRARPRWSSGSKVRG